MQTALGHRHQPANSSHWQKTAAAKKELVTTTTVVLNRYVSLSSSRRCGSHSHSSSGSGSGCGSNSRSSSSSSSSGIAIVAVVVVVVVVVVVPGHWFVWVYFGFSIETRFFWFPDFHIFCLLCFLSCQHRLHLLHGVIESFLDLCTNESMLDVVLSSRNIVCLEIQAVACKNSVSGAVQVKFLFSVALHMLVYGHIDR